MILLTAFAVLGLACAALGDPSLDENVKKTIEKRGTADIIISFKDSNVREIRARAKSRVLRASRAVRNQAMFEALNGHADATQANVLDMLKSHRSASSMLIRPLWITNEIAVNRAGLHVVNSLMNMEEISEIREAAVGSLISPVRTRILPENYVLAEEQWGVAKIEAPIVWERDNNRGQGVVIGSLDSGAYVEHEALAGGYRALNGWFDPAEGDNTPTDLNGHGTHTIGTIAGRTNGIGVAPEAQWISCKAMGRLGNGTEETFKACGQFFACPTAADGSNPRCDLAPQAVCNSWGFRGNLNHSFFDQVLETWIEFGIAPIFCAGNEGTSCNSLRIPGDSDLAITIGATSIEDQVTEFSSRGPNHEGLRKPDVSGPGRNIVSASVMGPARYFSLDGTSMAAPHVAGLAALLFSKRPDLTVSQLKDLLERGCQQTVPTGVTCGGIPDEEYPNNHVGYGRVSALASVDEIDRLRD